MQRILIRRAHASSRSAPTPAKSSEQNRTEPAKEPQARQGLGLDLRLEGTRLRFFSGTAAIPDAGELITSLERMVGNVELRLTAAQEQARIAEDEARTAKAKARAEAERRLAEAEAEIARLEAERSRN